MNAYTGGFYLQHADLIRVGAHAHTASLEDPISDVTLAAVNAIQATPWRINRRILEVMTDVVDQGLSLGDSEVGAVPPMPARLDDAKWDAMDAEARKAHAKERGRVFEKRASVVGRRGALLDKITIAREMQSCPAIYFAHSLDFRHRIYPLVSAGPSPQGNDHAKALLEFAQGERLGDDGFFWLCVRAAGQAGQDKLELVDRVQWVLDHAQDIKDAAVAPLEATWWAEQDEPWGFLATCMELESAWTLEQHGVPLEDFVSHLPVPLDGTCNGLQHLSALSGDAVGAEATNLLPGPRRDIYSDIAKLVTQLVEKDAAEGHEEALGWYGKVDRSVVKRAVMTTPYGVTDRGIRKQLIDDGHVPAEIENTGASADYLKDCLVSALGITIASGRATMAWLQAVADRLAKAQLPMTWVTPAGSTVQQAYYHMTEQRVVTLLGKLVIKAEVQDGMLNTKKCVAGAAPNFVHSFDSAHMSLTVNAAVAQGITSLAMIHDSYGAHASRTTMLSAVLREEFANIYETDWLLKTYEDLKARHPHVDLPAPPARGELDISLVRESSFFFS